MNEYKRFLVGGIEGEREFRTIELSHSQFSKTYYFVKDYENQNLPVDGDLTEFTAISMNISEPSETVDAEEVLTVQFGAIGSYVNEEIERINTNGFFEPVKLIYRKYYSEILNEPVLTLDLSVSAINFNAYTEVTMTAEDTDFTNKASGDLYTLERFQGLRGI